MFLKKLNENTITYKVFASWPVMLIQVIVAAISFHLNKPVICLFFMASMVILMLLLCKDMTPIFLPIVLLSMTVFSSYGATPKDFMIIAPMVIIAFVLLIVRPFIFRVQWRECKMLFPMILVAISITIGGIGYLSAEQYFKIVPLYYVFGVGFGLVIMYIYIMQYTLSDSVHNPVKILTKSMCFIGLMGILMIFPVALESLFQNKIWAVQWSNNLSTMFILSMPFAFYMAVRAKKYGVLFFLYGLLQSLGTILTLSRGGMLFGTLTAFICVIACLILANRRDKIIYFSIVGLIMLSVLIIFLVDKKLINIIEELMKISPNEARVNMFKIAIDNFLNNPIFGTGLAFVGDYYRPQKWAIYWYHSTPFQIIGSLGMVGVIAYGILHIYRIRICLSRPSKFNVLATISLIGFELMAFVNPGDFTPLPSMMMFTVILAIIEINNRNRVENADMLFAKIKAGNWSEYKQLTYDKNIKEPPDFK